jgi:photosystem II stability/assembly factor-like uncharacterized protein
MDEGTSWHRLAKLGSTDDLVLDNIIVDPANHALLYVAAWNIGHPDGGLWISHDAGQTWNATDGLRGQSIRALAQAPSNPRILYAGSLEGVFQSKDAGASWRLISPPGSHEIHEVESLAVDPANPGILYVGTWHLPWKTVDGGILWHNIKKGLIEDSDVFSIIIDPEKPKTIFLSACSGIYKSENAGELFRKIQGIPSTARRTRVLMQDPSNRNIVYAGTTEGLYKTTDSGKNFQLMTGPDVIVNDVFVDPGDPQRVLLATDRGGVLSSSDAGATFASANTGFSGRKVEALLVDRKDPQRLFAGVVNDKTFGTVFVSTNGGAAWEHIGDGLEGRDVFALAQASDGTIVAGTNHGIFALAGGTADNPTPTWTAHNTIQNTIVKYAAESHRGKRIDVEKHVQAKPVELGGRVFALDLSGDVWLASTTGGLLTSHDQGATWQGGPVMGSTEYPALAAHGTTLAAASNDGLVLSTDAGLTWDPVGVPKMLTRIHHVAFSSDGTLWLGAREGVYFTRDKGKSWMWIKRLPFSDVDDVYFDSHLGEVLVSSQNSDFVYAINPQTMDWKWWRTGYRLSLIRAAGGRLVAASLYDGVLVEPRPEGAETAGQR